MEKDFTVKTISEMEAAFGGGFIRARASLGATSFGMQVIPLPPNSGDAYPEHDHLQDGQEEVYVLLAGSATMSLPGEQVQLDRETFVRVGPGTRRRVRSGPEGCRLLVIGGVPGSAFEPQPVTELSGPEVIDNPTASSSMIPGSPPPQLP